MKTPLFGSSVLLLMLALLPVALQAAAPANDKFAAATVLTGQTVKLVNQSGALATADALDPYVGSPTATKPLHSIWYRFEPTFSANTAKIVIKDNTLTGMRAGIYQLSDPDGGAGSLISVAQATVTGGLDVDTIAFFPQLGQRYYLMVDAPGSVEIQLILSGQSNDRFADAQVLAGNVGTVTGSNENCTNVDDTAPALPGAGSSMTNGVWYSWTPTFTATAVVDTFFSELSPGTNHDTLLVVFTGNVLNTLTQIAVNDDASGTPNSRVTFPAVSGTTYMIWAGTFSSGTPGKFVLSYYPDNNPGEFRLKAPTLVSETQGPVNYTVRRFCGGSGGGAPSVTVGLAGGSATYGADYTSNAASFSAAFLSTERERTFQINPVQDTLSEGNESFSITLSAPTGGTTLGSPSSGSVLLFDTTGNSLPAFFNPTFKARETDGFVYIPLSRAGNLSNGPAEISFHKVGTGSTAVEGVDYFIATPTIFFAPGQSVGYATVFIFNDGAFKGQRSVTFGISSSDTSTPFAGQQEATLVIDDDDLVIPVAGRLISVLDNGGIAGTVDITVSATGAVTGKAIMARGTFAFTGKLDTTGALTVRLGPVTGPIRTLQLQLISSTLKSYSITLNDGEMGSTTHTAVTAINFSAANPCPVTGRYNYADDGNGSTVPQVGAGSIVVTNLGNATMVSKLFDGTAITVSGAADTFNYIHIGVSLYAGAGRALLYSQLSTSAQLVTNNGTFSLLRPGRANQSVELPGLRMATNALVGRYVAPAPLNRAFLTWSGGTGNADITNANLATVNKPFTISTANVITMATPLPESLKITITASTGVFTGTVIPTGSATAKAVYGVLLQDGMSSVGKGFFLNGILQGSIRLH